MAMLPKPPFPQAPALASNRVNTSLLKLEWTRSTVYRQQGYAVRGTVGDERRSKMKRACDIVELVMALSRMRTVNGLPM